MGETGVCGAPLTDFVIDAGTCHRPAGHWGIHWFNATEREREVMDEMRRDMWAGLGPDSGGADTMSEQPRLRDEIIALMQSLAFADEGLADRAHAVIDRLHDGGLREAAARPLDVEAMAEALNRLWSFRNADNSFVFPLPVPPDEQTARALAAAYKAVLETRLSQPGGSDAE